MIKVEKRPSFQRPYADYVYEYEITSDMTEDEVREYCTDKVHKVSKTENDERWFYEPYYKLQKFSDGKYLFTVTVPNCD